MKKLMTLFVLLLISTSAFAMGERVDRAKTENGTPIFENAYAQLTYAQEKMTAVQEMPTSSNMRSAALAFYDFRKIFPNEKENSIRSYFYEAKSYYLGNEFQKFNEVYAQFTEKAPTTNEMGPLLAEGALLSGTALQKKGDYQGAITVLEKIEKDHPQEKKLIIAARKEIYDCYRSLGRSEESISVLEDTLSTYPVNDYDQALFGLNIGLTYQKLGNKGKALEAFQKVIALPETQMNKGPRTAAKLMYEELKKNP